MSVTDLTAERAKRRPPQSSLAERIVEEAREQQREQRDGFNSEAFGTPWYFQHVEDEGA